MSPAIHVGDRLEHVRVADERPGYAHQRVVRVRIVHGRVAAQLREERTVPVGQQVPGRHAHCAIHSEPFSPSSATLRPRSRRIRRRNATQDNARHRAATCGTALSRACKYFIVLAHLGKVAPSLVNFNRRLSRQLTQQQSHCRI